MLSFFLACLASSLLVGRFGSRAGRWEAIGANLLASVAILAFAGTSNELPLPILLPSLLVLFCCSLLAGLCGVALGVKLRPKIR
jgi:hypothetical protein